MNKKVWMFLAFFCVSISAEASLVITNSDISSNAYTYSLTNDNILANIGNDVYSTSGEVGAYDFGWGRAVGFSGAGGELVYRFDFSGTSYRVSSVSFTENLQLYNWGNGDSGTMVTAYSTDGSSYSTLSQCATPSTDAILAQVSGTTKVDFASPVTVVYYTVTETGSSLYPGNNMWSRNGFTSAFTLTPVPEPMSLALLGLGGLLFGRRK